MATYSDKLQRIIKILEGRAGFSGIVPGTKIYQLAESIAYELMQVQHEIQETDRKKSISSSKNNELDEIGERFFGVKRLGEVKPFITPSMKALKFYSEVGSFGDINSGQDIIVPEGTIVSGIVDGIIFKFRLDKSFILNKNSRELYVSATLIQGSSERIPSNTLTTHNFNIYSQSINNLLKVNNPVPIMSGRKTESDDEYRFRIANALRSFAVTSAPSIYQELIKLPEVSNVYIENGSNGGGTFTVYVQGTTPVTSESALESVRVSLSQIVSPWQVGYNVVSPYYIGISVTLRLLLNATYSPRIGSLVSEKVIDYLNNFYGEEFYINNILQVANASHPNIVSVNFDSVRVYTGQDNIRSYTEVDFTTDSNPILFLSNLEKLIAEPINTPVSIVL